jgi:hypothetical protein
MTDGPVPIPLVLDLWSLGHSAGDIAQRLAVPGGHKGVTRIVAHARELGDPRAVLHCGENGRLLGRPGRDGTTIRRGAKTVKKKEAVILLPKPTIPRCKRGHERTERGECRACKKITDGLRYRAIKGLP